MAGNTFRNLQSINEFDVHFLGNEIPAKKVRYVDEKSNYILMRVDWNDEIERIKNIDENFIASFDAVVISDYNKGFLEPDDISFISRSAKLSFMDTKKALDNWALGIDYIKINEKESKNPKHNTSTLNALSDSLIITLGGNGARYKDKNYPTKPANVVDVVGAGDTFMSAFVSHILSGKNVDQSINFANKCSSESVKRRGVTLLGDIIK
jgi:sugar/nucleoside kinase (ribokinase family)